MDDLADINRQKDRLRYDSEYRETVDEFERRGFLDLEELLGSDWEERSTSNDPYELIEAATKCRFINSVDAREFKGALTESPSILLEDLQEASTHVEVVTVEDSNSRLHHYAFTSRIINNLSNMPAFEIHELVELAENEILVAGDESRNTTGIAFNAKDLIISYGSEETNYVNTYMSLSNMPVRKLGANFITYRRDGHHVKPKVDDLLARMDPSIASVGGQMIEDMNGFSSFLHEMGHFAYNYHDALWNLTETIALTGFNQRNSNGGKMADYYRRIVSLSERGAWDFANKFLSELQLKQGVNLGYRDIIFHAKQEMVSLMSYDFVVHTGDDPNPAAFSSLMRELRQKAIELGVWHKYDTSNGKPISACPLLQLYQEGHQDEADEILEKYL